MSYQDVNDYVTNDLAGQTAIILNYWVDNYNNANLFYGPNGYFNEATVQAAMYASLTNWLTQNFEAENALALSEAGYPGYNNRADLAIMYSAGQKIFIELKTSFNAELVNEDTNLLDLIAGAVGSPVTNGYIFYTVSAGNMGWVNYIEQPTQPNVRLVAINVTI